MSVQNIIQSLEKLVTLHESLLVVSKQKTEVIKEGSVEKLQPLLIKERKHVQVLEQAEVKRQQEVDKWFTHQKISKENATITGILEVILDVDERNELEKKTITLTKVITSLKQQEQLNQALIQQSMQFIQLSLDMMNPSIKNMNYGNKEGTDTEKRSVFDSKA
ncbi:flagellar protein FlgN [Virgibacillus ndiopensis]|uniref:flagellar protein FlgN n=1 Tax=Virgibacillus ndiopensis TaxID=2004408 RepID=UPI000C07B876|nr:flagellar protein FlgN [Virgibacillus ndiopensis]